MGNHPTLPKTCRRHPQRRTPWTWPLASRPHFVPAKPTALRVMMASPVPRPMSARTAYASARTAVRLTVAQPRSVPIRLGVSMGRPRPCRLHVLRSGATTASGRPWCQLFPWPSSGPQQYSLTQVACSTSRIQATRPSTTRISFALALMARRIRWLHQASYSVGRRSNQKVPNSSCGTGFH